MQDIYHIKLHAQVRYLSILKPVSGILVRLNFFLNLIPKHDTYKNLYNPSFQKLICISKHYTVRNNIQHSELELGSPGHMSTNLASGL